VELRLLPADRQDGAGRGDPAARGLRGDLLRRDRRAERARPRLDLAADPADPAALDQYVNLRPLRLLPGVRSPLSDRGPADLDIVCVRENSEGEYSGVARACMLERRRRSRTRRSVFTRKGIERIARYAFELAAKRPRRLLASCTKSNALRHSMVLWDEVVAAVAKDYPQVSLHKYHVDALAARMVTHPQSLDVIVASNLFGDILTDLGAALAAAWPRPGANINPERRHPSMFEPIHGTAPDIAGLGVANPIGAIWAGAMMLEHLGEADAAARSSARSSA
jgi:tartrate dehydrogenase/decarboxylase/D-malate dehydrogenase